MEAVFLGTSSMVPTVERNHTGLFVTHKDEKILIDCGEGTQRQFRYAGITPTKLTKLLITHWHGDHILGIPGLLMTLGAQKYSGTLNIYGPKGTKAYMERIFSILVRRTSIQFTVTEVKGGVFFENEEFTMEARELKHSTTTLGYAIHEKDKRKINKAFLQKHGIKSGPHLKNLQNGKDIVYEGKKIRAKDATTLIPGGKLTFVTDTTPCANAVNLAKNADVFICESTYLHDLHQRARERGHMTAKEAATIAKKAKAKKLILTHFSARYKDTRELEKEAQKIFKSTVAAKDLMKVQV